MHRTTLCLFIGALGFAVSLAACGIFVEPDDVPVSPETPQLTSSVPVASPIRWGQSACSRELPSGASVDARGEVMLASGASAALPPCEDTSQAIQPRVSSGWVEDTHWTIGSGNWFKQMTASWTVPAAPVASFTSSPPQFVAFWPGLEPSSNAFVVQPVLSYGFSASGGGNSWSFACYLALNNNTETFSTPIGVRPGDSLSGSMVASNCNAAGVCTWTCTARDNSTGQSSVLTMAVSDVVTEAFGGVIEINSLDSCMDYPGNGPTVISNIALLDKNLTSVTPSWSAEHVTPSPSCGIADPTSTASSATLPYTGWVCSPGADRACCNFSQGCSCNGTQTCSATGQWGICAGASPTGSMCR